MATLAPVIVTYCDKCGLPPEYCEYNTEVEHPAPAAASTSSDGVEAKLGQLSVEGGEENRGAAGEAVRTRPACRSTYAVRHRHNGLWHMQCCPNLAPWGV